MTVLIAPRRCAPSLSVGSAIAWLAWDLKILIEILEFCCSRAGIHSKPVLNPCYSRFSKLPTYDNLPDKCSPGQVLCGGIKYVIQTLFCDISAIGYVTIVLFRFTLIVNKLHEPFTLGCQRCLWSPLAVWNLSKKLKFQSRPGMPISSVFKEILQKTNRISLSIAAGNADHVTCLQSDTSPLFCSGLLWS